MLPGQKSTPSRLPLLSSVLLAISSVVTAGPCDLYASGNTPCVAAHATTRALYDSYTGPLYQVQRGSDNALIDIKPLSPGGVANGLAQDSFCARTTCLITKIYDQSGTGNHLTQALGGYFSGPNFNGTDFLASAVGAPVTLGGQKAYGVFISPGTGYRNDRTSGIATRDDPEGMYAVFAGDHYNDGCCFDYGNAETTDTDPGAGYMETLYFGDRQVASKGSGSGPWIQADLENGLYTGYNRGLNADNPTIKFRFLTAVVKGDTNDHWAIRGGNSVSSNLSTYYSGQRPSGYSTMFKEGAIVLGVGGDNSHSGQGTFYEGVMTAAYPSDETENAVQTDIVAAKYAATSLTNGPELQIGSSISFRATSACCTTKYLTHNSADDTTDLQVVSPSSGTALKKRATWKVGQGLGNSACFSFESNDSPGSYIRHSSSQLFVNANDGSKQFSEDATFCPEVGFGGQGNSFRSWNYPTRYFRHSKGVGYVAANGSVHDFEVAQMYSDDTTWVIGGAFA